MQYLTPNDVSKILNISEKEAIRLLYGKVKGIIYVGIRRGEDIRITKEDL